ncbi:hypothetical protein [Larkinella arboricola]
MKQESFRGCLLLLSISFVLILIALFSPFLVTLFCECIERQSTMQEEKEELAKEPFKKEIIANIAQYEKLMSFIAEKSDTIVNAINGTDQSYEAVIENKSDTAYKTITYFNDCHYFSWYSLSGDTIPKLPSFLVLENKEIWRELAAKGVSFEVCKQNKVVFTLQGRINSEKYISLSHKLYWHRKSFDGVEHGVYKDTLLNNKIRYAIEASSVFNAIDPCNIAPN